jgi:hypothetical protein
MGCVLSLIGCGLAIAALVGKEKDSALSTIGLGFNGLAAVAGLVDDSQWMSVRPPLDG